MGTGRLCDVLEKRTYYAKALICVAQSLLAIPTALIGFVFFTDSYWISFVFVVLENLLAEGWRSPTISMLTAVCPPNMRSSAAAVYLMFTTIFGTISNPLLGAI